MKKLILVASVAGTLILAVAAHSQNETPVATSTSSSSSSSSESLPALPPGEAPSDALKALLDRTKSQSHAYGGQIAAAVLASPRLAAQLNALVASGKLSDIVVQSGNGRVSNGGFRGAINDTQIVLTEGLLRDLRSNPNSGRAGQVADNTVFVLGHLAYHAENDAVRQANSDASAVDFFTHPETHGNDATQLILQMSHGAMDGEARAFLQGWNDVVDAATVTKGEALTLSDVGPLLTHIRYGYYLAASMNQPGGSLKWDPASGYLFFTDKNVQTMIATLGNAPMADIQ